MEQTGLDFSAPAGIIRFFLKLAETPPCEPDEI